MRIPGALDRTLWTHQELGIPDIEAEPSELSWGATLPRTKEEAQRPPRARGESSREER
jgi:hypothetical protein